MREFHAASADDELRRAPAVEADGLEAMYMTGDHGGDMGRQAIGKRRRHGDLLRDVDEAVGHIAGRTALVHLHNTQIGRWVTIQVGVVSSASIAAIDRYCAM